MVRPVVDKVKVAAEAEDRRDNRRKNGTIAPTAGRMRCFPDINTPPQPSPSRLSYLVVHVAAVLFKQHSLTFVIYLTSQYLHSQIP